MPPLPVNNARKADLGTLFSGDIFVLVNHLSCVVQWLHMHTQQAWDANMLYASTPEANCLGKHLKARLRP